MDLKRVSPEEAKKLMEEGYTLLDVRSMPEYAEEHAEEALNIPFLHKTPQGMIPNQDFVRLVQFQFPDPETRIITSCQMGGRSVRAAAELRNLGYHNVVDLRGGFGGEPDGDGNLANPGWKAAGLPTETGEPDGRSYKSINLRANQARSPDSDPPQPDAEVANPAPVGDGLNRFASKKHRVQCVKFEKDLPGLKRRPFPGELGEKIYREVSAEAWNVWVEHQKMLINEYRINSSDQNAMGMLMEQCNDFFFGDGAKLPEGYMPQGMTK